MRRPHIWRLSHKQNPNHSIQRLACHQLGLPFGSDPWRTFCSVGRTSPGPILLFFQESQVPLLLKEKCQERFSFLFQILGKCLCRSILVSLAQHCCVCLPKDLEGYFKNTLMCPLCFYPYSPLFSLFLSLSILLSFLAYLDSTWTLPCHGMERGHVARAGWTCSAAMLPLGFCSIHLGCKPEQLQQM